jgi:hypothetical protein
VVCVVGRDLELRSEVAWRVQAYKWLPTCSEYKAMVGQVHEYTYFNNLFNNPHITALMYAVNA